MPDIATTSYYILNIRIGYVRLGMTGYEAYCIAMY